VPLPAQSARIDARERRIAGLADRWPLSRTGLHGYVVPLAVGLGSDRYVPALYQAFAVVFFPAAICHPLTCRSAIGYQRPAELVPPERDDRRASLGKGPFRAFVLATLPGTASGAGPALA